MNNLTQTLTRRAVQLSWFTIAYNLIEGLVAISFGIQDDTIALAGFGVDSLIEVMSAFIVLWRFREQSGIGAEFSLKRERAATLGIGILFLILAVVTAVASILQLKAMSHPVTTLPGVVISAVSLSFMFFLWRAKLNVAKSLNSATMEKDAECSLACIKLSLVLFLGSLVYLAAPHLWWSDAVAALVLAGLIGREGWQTIRAARHENFSGGCGCAH